MASAAPAPPPPSRLPRRRPLSPFPCPFDVPSSLRSASPLFDCHASSSPSSPPWSSSPSSAVAAYRRNTKPPGGARAGEAAVQPRGFNGPSRRGERGGESGKETPERRAKAGTTRPAEGEENRRWMGTSSGEAVPSLERLVLHERVDTGLSAYIREMLSHEQGRQALAAAVHEGIDAGLFDAQCVQQLREGAWRGRSREEARAGERCNMRERREREEREDTECTSGERRRREGWRESDPILEGLLSQCGRRPREEDEEEIEPHLLKQMWQRYVLSLPAARERDARIERGNEPREDPICRIMKAGHIAYVPYTPYEQRLASKSRPT
ncbi:UNVERIFIED_CONTAM: hypothetical protein HHA_218130 [Hammondia hammondi]|eukprot:XP_008889317.1 hypothetical protein HHA_218130 [Hammondia hammondi]